MNKRTYSLFLVWFVWSLCSLTFAQPVPLMVSNTPGRQIVANESTNFFKGNSNLLNAAIGPLNTNNLPFPLGNLVTASYGATTGTYFGFNGSIFGFFTPAGGGGGGGNSNYFVASTNINLVQVTGPTGTTNIISVSPGVLTNNNTSAATFLGGITGSLTGNVAGNLTGNVTGNVSGSAGSFTGSLVGDVTGTQGATVVSSVPLAALPSAVLTNNFGAQIHATNYSTGIPSFVLDASLAGGLSGIVYTFGGNQFWNQTATPGGYSILGYNLSPYFSITNTNGSILLGGITYFSSNIVANGLINNSGSGITNYGAIGFVGQGVNLTNLNASAFGPGTIPTINLTNTTLQSNAFQSGSTTLSNIAGLANSAGYLYNNGSGVFSYGNPSGGSGFNGNLKQFGVSGGLTNIISGVTLTNIAANVISNIAGYYGTNGGVSLAGGPMTNLMSTNGNFLTNATTNVFSLSPAGNIFGGSVTANNFSDGAGFSTASGSISAVNITAAQGFLTVSNNGGVNEIFMQGTSQTAPGQNGIAWQFDGTSYWSEVVKTNTWNLAGNGFNGVSISNNTKAVGFAGDVHTPSNFFGAAFNDGAGFSTSSGSVSAVNITASQGILTISNNAGFNEIIMQGTSQTAPGQNGIAFQFDGTSYFSEVIKTNTWSLAGNGFNGMVITNSTKAVGFPANVYTPGSFIGGSFVGGGSGLTSLSAANLTGTVPAATLPVDGATITNQTGGTFGVSAISGNQITSGTIGLSFFPTTYGTAVTNWANITFQNGSPILSNLVSQSSQALNGIAFTNLPFTSLTGSGNITGTYFSLNQGSTGSVLSMLGNPSSDGAVYSSWGLSNYNIGASQVTSFMQASNGLVGLSNLIMYASTTNTLAYFNGSHQLSSGSVSADLGFSGGALSLLGTYQGNAFITNGASGASLTSLNAGNISSGTIGASYLPSALQFLNTNNGAALTNLAVPTLSSSNGSATLSQSINAKGGTNYDITAVSGGGSSTTNYQGIRVTNTADIGNVNVETNLNVTNNLIVGGIITGNGSGLTNLTPGILAASYFDNLVISNSVSTGSWGELIGAGGGGVYGETGAEVYYRSPGPAVAKTITSVMVDYIAPSINAGTNIYIVIRTNTPGGSSAAACICEVTNTAGITGPSDNLSTLNTSISIPAGILWDIQFTNNSSGNIVNGYFSVVVYGR